MISASLEDIDQRARLWVQPLQDLAHVADGETMIGGGSLPGGTLPTRLVAIGGEGKRTKMAQALSQRLRSQEVPIVGRISDDVLFLDPRSVLPEEDEVVLHALERVTIDLKS